MSKSRWRLVALVSLPLVAVLAYSFWITSSVVQHLRAADSSYRDLTAALSEGDDEAASAAGESMATEAGAARDSAGGRWWGAMSHLPSVGDDVAGVRALTVSLDGVASDAVPALLQVVREAHDVPTAQGVDLQAIRALRGPLAEAERSMARAGGEVEKVDSSGFHSALRPKFEAYVDSVTSTTAALHDAATTVEVLPVMLGASGQRRYLLAFQNNAEIRATGGMPGSYLEVTVKEGRLAVASGRDIRIYTERRPPLPITAAERAVYGPQLGSYFLDANFTPDYPRAADLMRTRWEEVNVGRRIDGVVAVDPVMLSYLLTSTGPVKVDGVTLKPTTVVRTLLHDPYVTMSFLEQDAYFGRASRAIFAAVTTDVRDPMKFARALGRSASEGRLLVRSFHDDEQERWADARVAGALSGEDGRTPHVDVGLNDGTGSKMSYYLRFEAEVRSTECVDGKQRLAGAVTLTQAISSRKAAKLPPSVTGRGLSGIPTGEQMVFVRVYGPFGGTVSRLRVDGKRIPLTQSVDLDGRPVATVAVLISSIRAVQVEWDMTTGPGQTGSGEVGITPSVVPGSGGSRFASTCSN